MLHSAFRLERGLATNKMKVWKFQGGDSNGGMGNKAGTLIHECGAHKSPCCGDCFWRE